VSRMLARVTRVTLGNLHGKEGVDHGPVEVRLARNWRTPLDLRQLSAKSRLPLTGAIMDQRRTPAQLVFDFCGCYELQPTTPNPPQFGSDVLIEVSTAAKRLRRLSRRRRPRSWRGT
jgi:hypothetical protein